MFGMFVNYTMLLLHTPEHSYACGYCRYSYILHRDAIFRKMTNRYQTDTNEIATTETKYLTDLYSSEKY